MSDRYKGAILSSTAPTVTPQSANGIYTLSQQTQYQGQGVWPSYGKQLTNSLRFRRSATAYLNRTPASASNRRTWTWSGWVKLGTLSVARQFFGTTGGSTQDALVFSADNQLVVFSENASQTLLRTAQLFRDPGAWYHVVVAVDTTQATSSNRTKIYVNGAQVTAFEYTQYPSQNFQGSINNNVIHYISTYDGSAWAFDGYLAEVNFIDGQALTPSSFGMTNAAGTWSPIGYSGSYGTNGFYLPFTNTASTSTLGNDFSGNSNTWTVNNISLTAGSTYDSMTDVPTLTSATASNYCTWNPLNRRTTTHIKTASAGNLNVSGDTDNTGLIYATIYPTTGKWYFEFSPANTYANSYIGIGANNCESINSYPGNSTSSVGLEIGSGNVYKSSLQATYTGISAGEIGMIAWDCDTGKVWMGRQGTWFNSGDPAAGTGQVATLTAGENGAMVTPYSSSGVISTTFGQRPFAYTPPTGFNRLNTYNLSSPTILAGNQYFDATLYTGNGTNNRIISSNLTPDFVWMKDRTNAYSHILIDSVRGIGRYLRTNGTNDENWDGNLFPNSGPTTNGFIVDGVSNVSINANGDSYVAWNWKASNAAAVTNTAGSISSQVSANPTAGFSIVTYTGNATSSQTVGHGLGVTPTFFILKSRGTQVWNVYSLAGGVTGNTILQLNDTSGAVTGGNISLTASSTTIGFGSASQVNGSGVNFVAYVFAPVAGYSAMGSYTGNGSTDGPFIFTGFRPRFVMFKGSSIASNWCMLDSARNTYNLTDATLQANSSAAELTNLSDVDFLSNGIKIRDVVTNDTNVSGQTYIYIAFAENPFKYANAR